ncbi:glutamate receptor 2.7-like isoform X2 [Rutidosis leptorrhynchoides]
MEIAMNDFNAKTGQNMTLHTRNSQAKLINVIREATNLIDTHQVKAILGLQTLEEALSIGEISAEAQIPTFSLFDSLPEWSLDRLPFLVQASPSQFAQTKAFVAILESFGWDRFTFIYEDINSASTQIIPHLMESIKESGIEMNSIVKLSHFSSLSKELEKIKTEQTRVFLVHASLETGIRLFQNAKHKGMMEKGYVWITTNIITDLLHTMNTSTFSTMEGVLGIGSYFPDTGSRFEDFSKKFQKKFKTEHPEEEYKTPGIFAVQAYDATSIIALALSKKDQMSGQKLLDTLSSTFVTGITGEFQLINRKLPAAHVFQVINVIGKYYIQVGFWSVGLGFSDTVSDTASYGTSLQDLGHIFWPGRPLSTPTGWAGPTSANALRVGVPMMALYKKFVKVEYDHKNHNFTYSGYSIELFKETVKRLPYNLLYEFYPFNGTYDSMVEQVYLKNFDMVVGDVSIVSRRYEYVEFTHPYTEIGLVMVVPAASYHGQWLFVKPFTLGMWALTIMVNVYTGLVVWVIERKHSPELHGSAFNQTRILLSLAFTRMFLTNGDELHSNLTRVTTVAWLLTAIIIGQCYTASLTSMLTVKRLIPRVTNYETLKSANAAVGYGRGSHVASYLEDVLGFKNENLKGFTTPEEYAYALRNREIAAVFLEAPFTKLFLAKYCNSFVTAGTTFGDGGFAFVLPKGSPMLPDFTKALLNVSEIGVLQDIEKKMFGSEHCVDLQSMNDEYGSLGLKSFWSLFLLTCGTSTVSLLIYAIISVRNHCHIEGRSLVDIISDARNYCLYRRKRLSRKVSDVDTPVGPNADEIT